MLERYFLFDPSSAPLLHGDHHHGLMLLSVAVAIASSALALYLSKLARQPTAASRRQLTLASGGVAMGVGIWAMHFIGMLAFDLPVRVTYHLPLTLLSLLPGLAASWLALWLLAQPNVRFSQLLLGGTLMALGIGAMHYSGMAAMQLTPLLRYDPLLFALSLAVAVVLAVLALWLRFALPQWIQLPDWQTTLLAAIAMGLAISGMHYSAMAAARFIGEPDALHPGDDAWKLTLALAVALTTAGISSLMGALNALLRYRDLYRQIDQSEARLRALVDTAVDGIITINQRGLVRSFNRAAQGMFGWTPGEVLGRNITMLMPEPYSSQHDGYLERYMHTQVPHIIGTGREVLGLRKDGSTFPMRLAVGRADSRGELLFVGFVVDLTLLKQAQEQLRIAASVFHHSYEAVLILDARHCIQELNPAFERIAGLPRADCLGRSVESQHPGTDFGPIWQTVASAGYWQGELTTPSANAALQVRRVSIAAVRDGGSDAAHHFIVVISDITQAKAYERELERIAMYDSLTGLPNRRLLTDRLEQAVHHAQRNQHLLAICYLDLDGFKQVNDQFGHEAGDQLLITVGQRILAQLRAEDTLARQGGDEMVLLLGDLHVPDDSLPILQRILEAICLPIDLPGGQARVSASMGLAIYPVDADTPDLLLRRADHAMYEAKQAGKNQCRRFGATLQGA